VCHERNANAREDERDLTSYLRPAVVIDSAHPAVIAIARRAAGDGEDARERAIRLYLAVRDDFRYDPYHVDLSVDEMKASRVLDLGHGWCVTKSVLLAAACRASGIPARVGYADVRNHLSTKRMRDTLESDIYYWHSYTSIHLAGQWLKATPAFNIQLCDKLRMRPLEFDGYSDSIYHPFDLDGNRHMEYLALRGEYFDVPIAHIRATFNECYPKLLRLGKADFSSDVAQETRGQ
jgi:transglutaminase-like putative cysteine protease